MRRYWKKGGGWRFRRASQVRTGRGRLDVALDRAEAASDEVCQVLILGLPEGPLLAGIEVHGRRMKVCGRRGRVTVPTSVPWRLIEAVRKADGKQKKVGDVVVVQPPMVTSVLPGEAVGLDKPPGKV